MPDSGYPSVAPNPCRPASSVQHRSADPLEQRVLDAALAGDAEALDLAVRHLRAVSRSSEEDQRLSSPEYLRFTDVVAGPRQTGKTWKLAEWVRAGRRTNPEGVVVNDRRLVVTTVDAGRHLVDAGLLRPIEVISVRQAQRDGGPQLEEYAVDETAQLIAEALKQKRLPAVVAVCTPYTPTY